MKAKKERKHLMTKKAKMQKRFENYNVIKKIQELFGNNHFAPRYKKPCKKITTIIK